MDEFVSSLREWVGETSIGPEQLRALVWALAMDTGLEAYLASLVQAEREAMIHERETLDRDE